MSQGRPSIQRKSLVNWIDIEHETSVGCVPYTYAKDVQWIKWYNCTSIDQDTNQQVSWRKV